MVMRLRFLHILFDFLAAFAHLLTIPIQPDCSRHLSGFVEISHFGRDILCMNREAPRLFRSLLHLLVSSADAVRNFAFNSLKQLFT
jgi:hypothetical protein